MALVRFTKEYFQTEATNDAPRADWQKAEKTGPIGHWYPGQNADLHEDEVQAVLDAGVAELIDRVGGEMSPFNRPLWSEAKPGEEWGSEEQATTEDHEVDKKTASAQAEPVTVTRKFEVPGTKKSHTLDPAAAVKSSSKSAEDASQPAKKSTAKK